MKNLIYLSAFAVMLLGSGCMEEITEVNVNNWNPEVAIPLANGSISLQDLLNNFENSGFVDVDNDNFMSVVYEGNVISPVGAELVEFPDLEIPVPLPSISVPLDMLPVDLNFNRFDIKSGNFEFTFKVPYPEDVDVVLEVINLKKNGQSFSTQIQSVDNGNMPREETGSIDISEYNLDLTTGNFELRYTATGMTTGTVHILQDVFYNLTEMQYSYAEGNFGQFDFDVELDSVLIDIFESAQSTSLFLEDPKIKLHFNNSFGVPIRVQSELLDAVTTQGPMHIVSDLDQGFDFDYPTVNEAGTFKTSTLTLNRFNSNLSDIIAANPYRLDYMFKATAFPENSNAIGFVKDDSYFSVDVDVELPLWFKATEFSTEIFMDFDPSVLDEDNIQAAEFKVLFENGFPFDANAEVYFVDDNENVLATLLDEGVSFLNAGSIDASGKVIAPESTTLFATLDKEELEDIKTATRIKVIGNLSTINEGTELVKIYSDYTLGIKMGVKLIGQQ